MTDVFWRGMIVGFVIAAPVGPVGLLCFRRALADGRMAALVAGLGAATADTVYGVVAAFGLRIVSDFLFAHRTAVTLVGGVFLCLIGLRTLRSVPTPDEARFGPGPLRDFLATFVITLTNPGTILAFMGGFALIGSLEPSPSSGAPHMLVVGVFAGSTLWWTILSGVAAALRSRLAVGWLTSVNRVAGVAILAFGGAVLASLAL